MRWHHSGPARIQQMQRSLLMLAALHNRASAVANPPRAIRERRFGVHAGAPFTVAFQSTMAHGSCVAVRLPPLPHPLSTLSDDEALEIETLLDRADLHPAEADHMRRMQLHQRVLFAGGRVALRRALERGTLAESSQESPLRGSAHRDAALEPVLPGAFGAPQLPCGWLGSISHTHGLAAAIAHSCSPTPTEGGGGASGASAIGIDVEVKARAVSPRLARRCLAPDERASLGRHGGLDERADALLRFSLKEALYKAIHPLLPTSIPWHSVTVWPAADGSCRVDPSALEALVAARLEADAQWQVQDGFFISTASALLVEPPQLPLSHGRGA